MILVSRASKTRSFTHGGIEMSRIAISAGSAGVAVSLALGCAFQSVQAAEASGSTAPRNDEAILEQIVVTANKSSKRVSALIALIVERKPSPGPSCLLLSPDLT